MFIHPAEVAIINTVFANLISFLRVSFRIYLCRADLENIFKLLKTFLEKIFFKPIFRKNKSYLGNALENQS